MPYVPSKKTDGVSDDREVLDQAIELVAKKVTDSVTNNFSLIVTYKLVFATIVNRLASLVRGDTVHSTTNPLASLADAIFSVAEKYGYEGAYLGELNYSITRLIQRVPQRKVDSGAWKESGELRYWLYACTVEALTTSTVKFQDLNFGIGGVFEDIKDEYKRRVNTAYEAAQIIKSGDCYDTPYYTRLVAVVDESGNSIGHMEVMLKRSDNTVDKDILDGALMLQRQ